MERLRSQEWIDGPGEEGWFNSYYDNHGRAVEGVFFPIKSLFLPTILPYAWRNGCPIDGSLTQGSILEHLLIQQLTAFYEVGDHNIYRLRGADWNDALDMASEHGYKALSSLTAKVHDPSIPWRFHFDLQGNYHPPRSRLE